MLTQGLASDYIAIHVQAQCVPVTAMSSVANIMTKSFCCFWKYDRSSGHRFFHNTLSESLSRLLHTSLHPPMELVKPVRIYGSWSLAFMMKVTV